VNIQERVIWAAGFFDGEGCVYINKALPTKRNRQKNPSHSLVITIAQRKEGILKGIKEFVGFGNIYKKGKNRGGDYKCHALLALKFLKKVLPYLRVKRLQARYGIQFQKGKTFKCPLMPKELKWRNMHKKLISLYNYSRGE